MADLLAEALMAYHNGRRSRLAAAADTAVESGDRRPAGEESTAAGSGSAPEPATIGSAVRSSATGPHAEAAAVRPRVRWTDLPRELVWREPGSEWRR